MVHTVVVSPCPPPLHHHHRQKRPRPSTALEEVREEERAPAPPFQPFVQQGQAPQSFGSSMAQSMTWGEYTSTAYRGTPLNEYSVKSSDFHESFCFEGNEAPMCPQKNSMHVFDANLPPNRPSISHTDTDSLRTYLASIVAILSPGRGTAVSYGPIVASRGFCSSVFFVCIAVSMCAQLWSVPYFEPQLAILQGPAFRLAW